MKTHYSHAKFKAVVSELHVSGDHCFHLREKRTCLLTVCAA